MTSATLLGEPLPVELMNTLTSTDGVVGDALADDDQAADWLRAVGSRIAGDPLDGFAGRPLRELRDALRHLAAAVTADPRPPATAANLTRAAAVATLNALAQAQPQLAWTADDAPQRSYRVRGTAGLAVALIAVQGVELLGGPTCEQLRPCLAPNCLLFFVKDHGRREWCSPACGNRARVARHYRRHHGTRELSA
jgi:predicted RNA-binding Zn ribbon-like protein